MSGDLHRAAKEGARWVGLIDGQFGQRKAVGPREVLDVMRQGVSVYGAASMGALRAAELHSKGMVGVGCVFEWYRDGVINAEDEVAVAYNPDTLHPLSVPLVTIRAILEVAERQQEISPRTVLKVLNAAQKCHYAERTLQLVLDQVALEVKESEALLRLAASGRADVKRLDAEMLLRRIAMDVSGSP